VSSEVTTAVIMKTLTCRNYLPVVWCLIIKTTLRCAPEDSNRLFVKLAGNWLLLNVCCILSL